MCDKAVDNYPHALEFIPECYKIKKMCDNAGDNYPSTIEYVPDQLETQEMCNKAVEKCPCAFDSVLDQHNTQEVRDKIVSDNLFKFKYCHNRLKKFVIKLLMIFYQNYNLFSIGLL